MSEKRFTFYYERGNEVVIEDNGKRLSNKKVVDLLNEQQELIEELQTSDEMGWKRAEHFEKQLKQKKIYIKRLEYKVQKFKEMNGEQQATIQSLEEENEQLRNSMKKLGNVDLVIELKYSYGYEKYLADVRVVDGE